MAKAKKVETKKETNATKAGPKKLKSGVVPMHMQAANEARK